MAPDITQIIDVFGWVLDDSVLPSTKLQQGDLIVFSGAANAARKSGIVITADCDLKQKKHARLVTMVPIVPIEVIIEQYLALDDCEKKRDDIERYLFANMNIDNEIGLEVKRAVLQDTVLNSQNMLDSTPRIAANFLFDSGFIMSIKSYKELMSAIKIPFKKPEAWKNQVKGRGDLFIVPDPKRLGVDGCVVWLRHLWQVPLSDIAIKTSDSASRPGERVARLDSPFRYRLTQLFGQVFSDIGLPDFPNSVDRFVEEAFNV